MQLTKGYACQVDDDDFEWLARWKWQASKSKRRVYAKRTIRVNGKITTTHMHKEIMKKHGFDVNGSQVDHVDGNALNNQKTNLRLASNTQNSQNRKTLYGTSRFKGVYFDKTRSRWKAHITIEGKQLTIGYFDTEQDAAEAYDRKAEKIFGEFACLNQDSP